MHFIEKVYLWNTNKPFLFYRAFYYILNFVKKHVSSCVFINRINIFVLCDLRVE